MCLESCVRCRNKVTRACDSFRELLQGVLVVDLDGDLTYHRGLVVAVLLTVFAVISWCVIQLILLSFVPLFCSLVAVPILSANINFELTQEKIGEIRVIQGLPVSTKFGQDFPLPPKLRVFSQGGRSLPGVRAAALAEN